MSTWIATPEFWPVSIASAVAVLGALMMVTRRDVVRAALWLVLTLASIAVIYVALAAQLVAMVQIIVYAGAIMVLFLFVIILFAAGREPAELRKTGIEGWAAGVAVSWLALAVVAAAAREIPKTLSAPPPRAERVLQDAPGALQAPGPVGFVNGKPTEDPAALGETMFSARHVFTVELLAVLLIVAMVGVVVLAKGLRSARDSAPDGGGA